MSLQLELLSVHVVHVARKRDRCGWVVANHDRSPSVLRNGLSMEDCEDSKRGKDFNLHVP
jgi:hypothetical protein